MDHPEKRYYKLTRFVLSVTGLWPYQNLRNARLIRAVLSIILLSSVFVQISSCFTYEITPEFIVDLIAAFLPISGSMCHLWLRIPKIPKYRELFDYMWSDWELEKTEDEMKILHNHAEITRLVMIVYTLQVNLCVIIYNLWIFMPGILDIISPLNESRPQSESFTAEFFIDKDRYIYLIRSHICIVIMTFATIFLANFTLLITFTQHACGMCRLLGFINIIEACHTLPFLVELLGIILTLSVTLIQMLTIAGNIERAIRSISFMVAMLIYSFILNYMGQRITDVSSSIYEKVYNSAWFNAIVSEQKSVLLIINRHLHPLVLTANKFYTISLQNFGMILQSAVSYCMFIRQI